MKIAELRAKSPEELKDLVVSSKKELFNLRMQDATGSLEKRNRFKQVRRDIARIKTLLNEKPGAVKPAAKAPKAEKPAAKKKTAKAKKEA